MTQLLKTQEQISQKAREAWAEHLPVCEMLAHGYFACLAPTNFPFVDSWAFKLDENAVVQKTARIQSKYTSSTRASYVQLERLGFDFLVAVRDTIKGKGTANREHAEIYVVPVGVLQDKGIWNGSSVTFSNIPNKYLFGHQKKNDVWMQIVDFLNTPNK